MADTGKTDELDGAERGRRLRELAGLFLRLGLTAFGGPAAHTAMMHDEVVVRRKWLSAGEFLDMVAATNFIPGPNSTELAIHLGYKRAGWRGLVVAGACFIVPAAVMCMVLAWVYVRYGQRPVSQAVLYGVKPVVIAVVGQAIWKLGRMAVKGWWLGVLGALALVAVVMGVHELLVLLVAGAVAGMVEVGKWRPIRLPVLALTNVLGAMESTTARAHGVGGLGGKVAVAATAVAGVAGAPLVGLFFVFLKIGSVLLGSGYVLLAFLRTDIVGRGWLTETQLLDAVAVGQVTPGPVFTTATFIGYVAGGPMGAVAATAGIFLPAFVFVGLTAPLLAKMRGSKVLGAFLDGLNVASLALMGWVTWQLAGAALVDGVTWGLAGVSLCLLVFTRVNSVWLVLAGAVLGVAAALFP